MIVGLIEHSPKMNLYMNFIIDQLLEIYHDGVVVHDSSDDDKELNIKCMLLYVTGDYPAHAKVNLQQAAGYQACMKCQVDVSTFTAL